MPRFRIALVLIATVLLSTTTLGAADPKEDYKRWGIPDPTTMEGTTPAQWRVLWTADPQTQATVSWSTASESKTNTVYYDTAPHEGKVEQYKNKVAAHKNGKFSGGTTYYHHATLAGLSPGTTCYFVIESDGKVSREMHFKTAPQEDIPIRIVFASDSRSGGGR